MTSASTAVAAKSPNRADRLSGEGGKPPDNRNQFERDRDRILYATAFRRLAEVTQVVGLDEGHTFHNRLTHSVEVAQFARRLAEKLKREQSGLANEVDLSADVAEAASLAHDIGHPPFGHIGEKELDRLVAEAGIAGAEGFEGNAQSFRVITKLACHNPPYEGLDLTRATLDGVLKYPWLRQPDGFKNRKWGAYGTEKAELEWARALHPKAGDQKGLEAQLMDWADEVTYAVHDAADFYRAGLIPLDRLASSKDDSERQRFLSKVFERTPNSEDTFGYTKAQLADAFNDITQYFQLDAPFQGAPDEKKALRLATANLVSRYIGQEPAGTITLARNDGAEVVLRVNDGLRQEVKMLNQLVWNYVILGPALATQQYGLRQVIGGLFRVLWGAVKERNFAIFPFSVREQVAKATTDKNEELALRFTVDLISGLTDREAVELHSRLTGVKPGLALYLQVD